MFTRLAKNMNKWLSYPSNVLAVMGMVAMVFVMVAVVADVLKLWLADSPLRGESDLEQLGFAIMVWGPMALATFKGSHIALTTLLDKLPGLLRPWADLTIALASGGILGVVTWRLVEFGINQAERLVSTGILGIPIEPFIDFAAVGCGLMALVFLARVPEAVGKILKEQ